MGGPHVHKTDVGKAHVLIHLVQFIVMFLNGHNGLLATYLAVMHPSNVLELSLRHQTIWIMCALLSMKPKYAILNLVQLIAVWASGYLGNALQAVVLALSGGKEKFLYKHKMGAPPAQRS